MEAQQVAEGPTVEIERAPMPTRSFGADDIDQRRKRGNAMIIGGSGLIVAGVGALAGTTLLTLSTLVTAGLPGGNQGSAAPYLIGIVAGSLSWPAMISGGATMVGIGAKWKRDAKRWRIAGLQPTFGFTRQSAYAGVSFRF